MSATGTSRRRRLAGGLAAAAALAGSFVVIPLAGVATAATNLNVAAGGATADGTVDGQGFYPGLVTVRTGDTVTWTFKGAHTVNFYTAAGDPEAPGVGDGTFTGVNDPSSSGIKFPAPGQDTYALTFASTGNFVYFCALHPGMAGLVQVVEPSSAVPSTTQADADAKGAAQLAEALAAGNAARAAFTPTTEAQPNGTTKYGVANGISEPQKTTVNLAPVVPGGPTGTAELTLTGDQLQVNLAMTGLVPGEHPAHIHQGQCGLPSPPKGASNDIIIPFPNITADVSGVGKLSVTLTAPAQGAIPAFNWYLNVHTSPTVGAPVSCGNVVVTPASSLRFLPPSLTIKAGDTVTWNMLDFHEVHPLYFGPPASAPQNPFAAPSGGNVTASPDTQILSGPQFPGSAFSLTFNAPGTYQYLCTLHAPLGMVGSVTVTPGELPPTGSSSSRLVLLAGALAGIGAILVLGERRWRAA